MTTYSPASIIQPGGEQKTKTKKQATPKPQTFLFINKDATSEVLSRSSGPVATSINSHVQRWQRKKGKPAKSQPNASPLQQIGSTAGPTYRDCITKFRPRQQRQQQKMKKSGRTLSTSPLPFKREYSVSSSSGPSTAYSTSPESSSSSAESEEALKVVRHDNSQVHRDIIYRANFSGPDCIDPFRCTNAHHPGFQPIIEYYLRFALASTFDNTNKAKATKKEPPHFPAIRSIVQGALTQKMHEYALLAATAARMKRVSGVTFTQESSPESLLGRAVRCFREYFASCNGQLPVDDRQVILDIFYLCVCQWYEKSLNTARTHLAFIRQFWTFLKPSESMLDKYIHDMIGYNDVFLAMETQSRPLFELTWEPESLPPERVNEIEEEVAFPTPSNPSLSLPTGAGFTFFTTNTTQILPLELVSILKELPPLIQSTHHQRHRKPAPTSPETARWISLKTQALLHRLLSLPPATTTCSKCITQTLLILLSSLSTSPAWRAGKLSHTTLSKRLRAVLQNNDPASATIQMPSLASTVNAGCYRPIVIDNIHYETRTTLSALLSPDLVGIVEDDLLLWMLISGAYAAGAGAGAEIGGDEQKHNDELNRQWFLEMAAHYARRMGIYDAERLRWELSRYLFLEEELGGVVEEVVVVAMGTQWRVSGSN